MGTIDGPVPLPMYERCSIDVKIRPRAVWSKLVNEVLMMDSGSEIDSTRAAVLAVVSLLVIFMAPMFSSEGLASTSGQPRSCLNTWSVDDTDNMTTNDGTFAVTVEKISTNAAIFVEDGQIVSSTVLNDIVSNWESIIFPSTTNYFGNPPDIDDNCQIEIAILSIDGPGGEEGYFESGVSSIREALFLDIDDLSERNRLMAHEFGQLIHHENDPFEYIWIDEGLAGLSEFINFGESAELEEEANSWALNSSTSLRWWDGRVSDVGSSFLFSAYLADKLGGPAAIRQMVSNPSLGGNGVENLARNPGPGSTPVGTSMSEIFANFSAALTLDSAQGAFGFSEIDLIDDCSAGGFCKGSISAENDQWSEAWQSSGHSVEGWGLKSFRFTQGDGYPLSIMVQPDRFGFEGAIVSKEASSGTWTMEKLRIDSSDGRGTGLVHGFGNTTSEVLLLVWYNSLVDDCDFDFANCGVLSGGNYPSGSFTVSASQVTSPAEVSIDSIVGFDRDGDFLDDSVEIGMSVSSSAFSESLSVEFSAFTNNSEYDSADFMISVGNSEPEITSVWFTPPFTSDWSFTAKVRDITGELQDIAQSLPEQISNMKPVGSGSISSNETQTWTQAYIFGGGYDSWGFGLQNGSFGHNETPQSYIWDLGDGNSSSLKNPIHSFTEEGEYVVTLIVKDQGDFFSEAISWDISVNDTSDPIPEISVDGLAIQEELTVQTNQRVQFSAFGTSDNVPVDKLFFSWDWGDGSSDSGIGIFEVGHSWIDGSSNGTVYSLELLVSDGQQSAQKSLLVTVLNRAPYRIFSENLEAFAVTPLEMPEVFEDEDGIIAEFRWTFEGGVNLGGMDVSLASDFTQTSSFEANPIVSWREPGMKNVTLEVVDDDGNTSTADLQIEILNQRPVALFERPPDGKIGDAYIFSSSSFDPDGDSSELSHYWTFSDRESPIENSTSVSRTFSNPGLHSVSLKVVDERGLESAPKTFLLYIENPLPVPIMTFSCPSDEEGLMFEIPEEGGRVTWKVPRTDEGGAFVAPGNLIRFDGSGSFDADPEFEGMASTDFNNPDWNGIVDWIWDFGDASPPSSGPQVWHSFERSGEYTVRLTVVDGFGGGDSNTTEMKVIVSSAPIIGTSNPISTEYVVVGDLVNLSGAASDSDLEGGIIAWMDNDAFFDSDGDGDPRNDRDQNLTDSLDFAWDINVFLDEDCMTLSGCDGDARNDWIMPNQTWAIPGEVRISMTVCDGLNVCESKDFVITVLSIQDTAPPKTLSDLTVEDLVPGREHAGLLALVALVAVLGWMVLRERDDDELDALENVKKYDVDEVEEEGGMPGMDQHSPPPQPKYLTADQRTNRESGYVRPIRTRRKK